MARAARVPVAALLASSLVATISAASSAPGAAADFAHGRTVAAACAGCHGAAGEGKADAGIPRLAGLDAAYLQDQLAAFAAGTRANATMAAIAAPLDAGSRADVAAYYASLPVPATPPSPAVAAQLAAGRELALRGDWAAAIPPCASCHGRDGLGVGATFPAIAGQSAAYAAAQLAAWKSGTRHDDPHGLMRTVAVRLDDGQIAAVAAYYASLPGAPDTKAGAEQ